MIEQLSQNFKKELEKLPEGLQDIILKYKPKLTGGCLISISNNQEINDYDCVLNTKENVLDFMAEVITYKENISDVFDNTGPKIYISDNAVTINKIQILLNTLATYDSICDNFDFQHTKWLYDYVDGELLLPSETSDAINNMELVYTGKKFPLKALMRMRKFIARGMIIDNYNLFKMIKNLSDFDLDDGLVLFDQLDGLYFSGNMEGMDTFTKLINNLSLECGIL